MDFLLKSRICGNDMNDWLYRITGQLLFPLIKLSLTTHAIGKFYYNSRKKLKFSKKIRMIFNAKLNTLILIKEKSFQECANDQHNKFTKSIIYWTLLKITQSMFGNPMRNKVDELLSKIQFSGIVRLTAKKHSSYMYRNIDMLSVECAASITYH